MREYIVIYEQAGDGGWSAFTPEVPGVYSAGDSRTEAGDRLREALALHHEELARAGREPVEPNVHVGTLTT